MDLKKSNRIIDNKVKNVLPGISVAISGSFMSLFVWIMVMLPVYISIYGAGMCWISIGLFAGNAFSWLFLARRITCYSGMALLTTSNAPDYFKKRYDSPLLKYIISIVWLVVLFSILIYVTEYTLKFFMDIFQTDERLICLIGITAVAVFVSLWSKKAAGAVKSVLYILMLLIMISICILVFIVHTPGEVLDLFSKCRIEGGTSDYLNIMFVDDGKLSVVSIISLVSLGIGSMGMPFIYDGAVNAKSIKDIDKGRINGIIFDGIVVVSGGVLSLLMAPVVYPFKIQEDNCFYQLLERMVDALLAGRSIRFPVKIVVIGTFALLLIMLISGLLRMIQGLITGMFPEAEKLKLPQGGLLIDLGTVIICALLLCIFVYMNSMCTYKNVIWAWEFVEAVISAPFVLSLISLKTTKTGTLWGMIMGAAAYLFWIFAPVYNGKSLENVTELNGGPVAFAAAFITIYVVSRFTARPADEQIKILARVKMEQQ